MALLRYPEPDPKPGTLDAPNSKRATRTNWYEVWQDDGIHFVVRDPNRYATGISSADEGKLPHRFPTKRKAEEAAGRHRYADGRYWLPKEGEEDTRVVRNWNVIHVTLTKEKVGRKDRS